MFHCRHRDWRGEKGSPQMLHIWVIESLDRNFGGITVFGNKNILILLVRGLAWTGLSGQFPTLYSNKDLRTTRRPATSLLGQDGIFFAVPCRVVPSIGINVNNPHFLALMFTWFESHAPSALRVVNVKPYINSSYIRT